MKRIVYSLLFIFLIGCGEAPSKIHRIVIQSSDSSLRDYILLSVRQKEIVVTPVILPDPPEDSLLIHAITIRIDSIQKIYYRREHSFRDAVPGLLWGGPIAVVIAFLPRGIYGSDGYYAGAFGIGIIAGGALSYALGGDEEEFDSSRLKDNVTLSRVALYPVIEPPELQKIP